MFGKTVPSPRLSAWYGDPDAHYCYSGLYNEPLAWISPLSRLKETVADYTGESFNSVLANLYRNGSDGMGWHSDDEAELGPRPVIASLSLGATRRFQLQPRRGGKGNRRARSYRIELEHGSLLMMTDDLQKHWRHSVPKTRLPVGPRINLTFRRIIPS